MNETVLAIVRKNGDVVVLRDETAGARCPWWSFTKTVIALCLLKRVEAGELALDVPLEGRPFTIRQLLQHRAGVPNYGGLAAYHEAVARGEKPWSRTELLERVGAERLDYPPGTGWAYSNVGYLHLRDLLEAVTGLPLGAIVARDIAGPLGLASPALAKSPQDFAAMAWARSEGYDPGWVYHGCLTGTATDALRLLDAAMRGRVIGPAMLEEMRRAHPIGGPVEGRPWTATGYGLGLMAGRMGEAGAAVGHSGGGPFSVAAVYHFPDLPEKPTVAAFGTGSNEAFVEFAARDAALSA